MNAHMPKTGCDLQSRCNFTIETFVESTVRHTIAYIVYMKSHVQVSHHLVQETFCNEMTLVRIEGATYNQGNTVVIYSSSLFQYHCHEYI